MIPLRTALRVALVALLAFSACIWPGLGVSKAYAAFFRAQASVLFASKSDAHRIDIVENRVAKLAGDSAVEIRWAKSREYRTSAFKTLFAFLPTALFVALVVTTPVSFGRRLRLLWMGLLLIDSYVVCGTGLVVLKAWYVHAPVCTQAHQGWLYSGWFRAVVEKLDAILFQEPSVNLLVALVIWLALLAGRDGMRATLESLLRPAASA